MDKRKCY